MEPTRPLFTVEGDEIALGPTRRELIQTYQRWMNDPATLRTLGRALFPWTEWQQEEWLLARKTEGEALFTIFERASGRAIGNAGLHVIDERNDIATLGIVIGEADARGRGYGTEAVRLLLDYGFTARGLHNIQLTCYAFNLAGQRCYEKAGFKLAGRRREARRFGGKRWDELFYDVLATEFTGGALTKHYQPDEPR
jgi:diamine N-acetyltransferase